MLVKSWPASTRRARRITVAKITVDGYIFDSQVESRRWLILKQMETAGEIRDLTRQPKFLLRAYGSEEPVCTYTADFRYYERSNDVVVKAGLTSQVWKPVVEDVKGRPPGSDPRAAVFNLKKRWMLAEHGIDVRVWLEKPPEKKPRKPRRMK